MTASFAQVHSVVGIQNWGTTVPKNGSFFVPFFNLTEYLLSDITYNACLSRWIMRPLA